VSRYALIGIGTALCVAGAVWILQGMNVLKGSFMSGEPFWAWMGAVAILAGLPIALRGARRR
jgi:hypothetical protein